MPIFHFFFVLPPLTRENAPERSFVRPYFLLPLRDTYLFCVSTACWSYVVVVGGDVGGRVCCALARYPTLWQGAWCGQARNMNALRGLFRLGARCFLLQPPPPPRDAPRGSFSESFLGSPPAALTEDIRHN